MTVEKTFDQRLREWRESKRLSCAEAAALIHRFRTGLDLSPARLQVLEIGLEPLPEEQSILERIIT